MTQYVQGIRHLWPDVKPLIGMVHLRPLPGAPRWEGSMSRVLDRALADARVLASGGMDGIMVENFLDTPFFAQDVPPETVAAMSRVVAAIVQESGVPVGVNVLRNDARAALGVAQATGASFIRVNVHTGTMWTDQGMVEGRAAETLRLRAAWNAPVAILADVLVKHAVAPPGLTLAAAAADSWSRGLADALIVSGSGTGRPTDPANVPQARQGAPAAPILVGSGVTPESVQAVLDVADGAIVGTTLAAGGVPGEGVDPERVKMLMEAARG